MTTITSLELTSFGKFKDKTIPVSDGVCEFIHSNEWGKSTVCDFILFMLYGAKASSSKRLTLDEKHLEKYLPWDGDKIAGAMELTHDGIPYRIERSVTAKGTARITVYKSGEEYALTEPGRAFFGVDRDTFMRTFLVRQTDIRFDKTADCEAALRNLVTTGDEDVSFDNAMDRLNKLQTPIQSQKQRNTGKIPTIKTELSGLELERLALEREKAELDARLEQLPELTAALERAKAESEQLQRRDAAARGNDAAEVLARLRIIDDSIRECEGKLEAAQLPLSQIEKEYMSSAFTELALVQNTLAENKTAENDIQFEIDTKKATFTDYAEFEAAESEIKAAIAAKPRPNTVLLATGAIIGILGAVAAVTVSPILWVLCAVGLLTAVAGATIIKTKVAIPQGLAPSQSELAHKYSKFTSVRDEVQRLSIELGIYRKNISDGNARLEKALVTVNKINADYGIDSIDALNARLSTEKAEKDIISALDKFRQQRAMLIDGKDEDKLRADALLADGSDLTLSRLNQLKSDNSDKIRELTDDISAFESTRINREKIKQDINDIIEKRNSLSDILSQLEYQNDVYNYVREALSEANEKINNTYSPILSKRIAPVLSALTGGRYTDAAIDKEFRIRIKSEGEYHELGYFSRGTADAVYLAVRLCMADILCESAPLILDDPFWSFDSDRLKNATEIIKKISESRQVLLFGAR